MTDLAAFRGIHRGGGILVCACGESLNSLTEPERFITIGVNDVGRKFDPNYLVVVDPREAFKGDRFHYVETSRAGVFFTQRTDLAIAHPNIVRFRLGTKDGTDFSDPGVLNYSVTTPYVALCLAVHMGAANIGLIGVDFTDNHFFGATGPHAWSTHLDTIDAQFYRLCRAALARGVRVFNLSAKSRLTAVPKMTLETFASLAGGQTEQNRPLRIVSYATTPLVGVPAMLARCINARTPHYARCIWAHDSYDNGISFADDINWSTSPARTMEELDAADVVIVHNGKTDERHRAILATKAVVTVAHNYLSNVDDGFVRAGFPGLVVGQYQATLPEFRNWSIVPNPIALWEQPFETGDRSELTIAYTPSGRHDVYPRDHRLYWHGKGYHQTIEILDRLAAYLPIRLELVRDRFVPHVEAIAMKRRAHILIDECVTGSYHRSSLEGLAAGCVVINGIGLLPGVAEALRRCTGEPAPNPFVGTDLTKLEAILKFLIELGPDILAEQGAANRAWMERYWDFTRQWQNFWQPAIDQALQIAATRALARRAIHTTTGGRQPDVSVVIASRDEGALLNHTVRRFAAFSSATTEIIVVDDGSKDDSIADLRGLEDRVTLLRQPIPLGISQARNLGARHARGRLLLFSDAHVAVPPAWAEDISAVLADPDVGAAGPAIHALRFPDEFKSEAIVDVGPRGYGMKWSGAELRTAWLMRKRAEPYDVPLLPGAFVALRRNVFAAIGGFDPALDGGGIEDAELSFRLWSLGYRCVVLPALQIGHLFRGERHYPLGLEKVIYNRLRLAKVHFGRERQRSVIGALSGHDAFAAVLAQVDADDTESRRDRLQSLRLHDDDWYFQRFNKEQVPGLSVTEGPL